MKNIDITCGLTLKARQFRSEGYFIKIGYLSSESSVGRASLLLRIVCEINTKVNQYKVGVKDLLLILLRIILARYTDAALERGACGTRGSLIGA